jgi:Tfp pilus assembly PilM family ATPase
MITLPAWLSLDSPASPTAAIDISMNRVAAASVEARGGRLVVTAHAVELLHDGAVAPSLTSANLRDRTAVAAAVRRMLEAVGRPRRVALTVPDPVAKISLVRLEKVPERSHELEQVVRWQVRRTAPFPIEEAQVSFFAGSKGPEGQEFVVSLAKRQIVEEYESLCEAAGSHAGLVDISTFNVINAAMAVPTRQRADWLLVNVAPGSASIAILRGGDLILFRSRGADADGTLADLVHQTAMYYEDRLQGSGFGQVLLCGAAAAHGRQVTDVEQIRRSLEERLQTSVETLDVRSAVALSDRIMASQALLDTLAPLVGALVRGREVAA